MFREAGWRVELYENMPGMLWKKFAYIAGSAAVCAATNSDYQEMRSIPETRDYSGAIEEVLTVGRACGADPGRLTHLVDGGTRPSSRYGRASWRNFLAGIALNSTGSPGQWYAWPVKLVCQRRLMTRCMLFSSPGPSVLRPNVQSNSGRQSREEHSYGYVSPVHRFRRSISR